MHFVKFKDGNIINLEEVVTVFKQNSDIDEDDDDYDDAVETYEVVFKNDTRITLTEKSEYETVLKALSDLNVLTEES